MLPIDRVTRNSALALFVLLLVPGQRIDAQAQQTLADQREMQVDLRLRGFNRRILLDTLAVWTKIGQSPTAALADARFIIDSLKLPITRADTLARVIYNNALATRSLIRNRRMSEFLRCGWGPSGDYADTWRISLGYAVYVKPAAGGGSSLGVAIAGSATDVEGASKPPVQCSSTGGFEQLITRLVKDKGEGER